MASKKITKKLRKGKKLAATKPLAVNAYMNFTGGSGEPPAGN